MQPGPRPKTNHTSRRKKVQTLKNEANLQLRRLHRELESLQQEQQQVVQLLQHLDHAAKIHVIERVRMESPSPTSILDPGFLCTKHESSQEEQDFESMLDFDYANLDLGSILKGSGAFSSSADLVVAPPPQIMRLILPPPHFK